MLAPFCTTRTQDGPRSLVKHRVTPEGVAGHRVARHTPVAAPAFGPARHGVARHLSIAAPVPGLTGHGVAGHVTVAAPAPRLARHGIAGRLSIAAPVLCLAGERIEETPAVVAATLVARPFVIVSPGGIIGSRPVALRFGRPLRFDTVFGPLFIAEIAADRETAAVATAEGQQE